MHKRAAEAMTSVKQVRAGLQINRWRVKVQHWPTMSTSSQPYYQQSICVVPVPALRGALSLYCLPPRHAAVVCLSLDLINGCLSDGVRWHADILGLTDSSRHYQRRSQCSAQSSLYYRPETLYRPDAIIGDRLEQAT